jgi:hypothetical protein
MDSGVLRSCLTRTEAVYNSAERAADIGPTIARWNIDPNPESN